MPRIPLPDPATLTAAARAEVERTPINLQRLLAGASEGVFLGFNAFSGAFYGSSDLPAPLREVAILRVAELSECAYERMHHVALALHVGLTQEQVEAIRRGEASAACLSEAQRAVLKLAEEVVLKVRASDATLTEVRRHLSDRQLLDLILVTGLYRMVAAAIETSGIALDGAEIDWQALGSRVE